MSDNLKQTLHTIINTSMTIDQALEDNRISPLEWAQIAIKSIGFWKVIKEFETIKEEIASLNQEEKTDLINFVQKQFDLRDDKLEETVENLFETFLQVSIVLASLKEQQKN